MSRGRCRKGYKLSELSALEKGLLSETQRDFPVCSRPYAELGRRTGCSEDEAYDTLESLRERGFIRRIGGVFDSVHLGYKSELVAMEVQPERLCDVAQIVNQCGGVTHNYEREDDYNLWFTITRENGADLDRTVCEIEGCVKPEGTLRLPARRKFKVRVVLPME